MFNIVAVPKKKMSKSKRNSRNFAWRNKVLKKIKFSISLGKSVLQGKNFNFILQN